MSTSGYDSDIQIEIVTPQDIVIAHPMRQRDLRKVEKSNLLYSNPRKRAISKPDRRFPDKIREEWHHKSIIESNFRTSGDLVTYNRSSWQEKFLQSKTKASPITARYKFSNPMKSRLKK